MQKDIMELVKNKDFASVAEFYECLSDDKEGVLEYLKWRVGSGCMKNEKLSKQYIESCSKLIAKIFQ